MTTFEKHNPSLANPIMTKLLNALGNKWQDCSYGDDCVASISREIFNSDYDDFMAIYLPNSTKFNAEEEEFNTYSVNFGGGQGDRTCETLEEAIVVVQAFEFTL